MFYNVDQTKCTKCKICATVCTAGIVEIQEDGFPHIEKQKESRCISCGHCMVYCPADACNVTSMDKSKFLEITNMPTAEQAEMFLRSRRSTRFFKSEDLDKKILESIILQASTAPTAKNMQPVSWVVITSRAMMLRLADGIATVMEQMAEEAGDSSNGKMLTALVKAHRSGRDIFMRNAVAMAIAITPETSHWPEDATIAATYLELAAHSKGLGTCWAGFFINAARNSKILRKIARIPEDHNIGGAILLGKPTFTVYRAPHRKEQTIIWN